jgi:hypothetical protein
MNDLPFAFQVLMNSKLPVDVLGRIWELSDIDKDGYLDRDEFALVTIFTIFLMRYFIIIFCVIIWLALYWVMVFSNM